TRSVSVRGCPAHSGLTSTAAGVTENAARNVETSPSGGHPSHAAMNTTSRARSGRTWGMAADRCRSGAEPASVFHATPRRRRRDEVLVVRGDMRVPTLCGGQGDVDFRGCSLESSLRAGAVAAVEHCAVVAADPEVVGVEREAGVEASEGA